MNTTLFDIANIQMPIWLVYVTIATGLLSCFLGYKLLRIWMAVMGFIIGMSLGYFLSIDQVKNVAITILIGFILGLLIGFIAYRIYLLGVFLIAFSMTFLFIGQLLARYNEPSWLWLALTLVISAVVAGLAIKFVKSVIIISTSLNGATSVMVGVFSVMTIEAEGTLLVAILLLALLGMMVQFFTNKLAQEKEASDAKA